jgi:predicted RNase H-like nuclease
MLTLGVDLAWQTTQGKVPNETGVVALDDSGIIVDAGWVQGIDCAVRWIDSHRASAPVCFVDAPLVVSNATHQRWCEKEVGRHYGSAKVSANSTNLAQGRERLGGVRLLDMLTALEWAYDDGLAGPPGSGLRVSECYPYTTLVGAFGFTSRPAYKRRPKAVPTVEWRTHRAGEFQRIVTALVDEAPSLAPLDIASHGLTAILLGEPPTDDRAYKHQEDLMDAVLCAWTAQVWLRHGMARCQVLHGQPSAEGGVASIIAPYDEGRGQGCACDQEWT